MKRQGENMSGSRCKVRRYVNHNELLAPHTHIHTFLLRELRWLREERWLLRLLLLLVVGRRLLCPSILLIEPMAPTAGEAEGGHTRWVGDRRKGRRWRDTRDGLETEGEADGGETHEMG
ncbi:hypothetical protein Pcinc_043273 [Petrolisthes cinctipes]|uniref:Uncharacterized protein n=1 Tax=Petrolisthes cinctipes TaxID=88211 RepID=A0AAE1BJ29_PETCI|nr:hypothetical protein Pcinc_043273 [Petrolisthes cinctipes]